jgi:hypothetical protein
MSRAGIKISDRVLGSIASDADIEVRVGRAGDYFVLQYLFASCLKGGLNYPAHSMLESWVLNGMHRTLHPPNFMSHKTTPALTTNLNPSQIIH